MTLGERPECNLETAFGDLVAPFCSRWVLAWRKCLCVFFIFIFCLSLGSFSFSFYRENTREFLKVNEVYAVLIITMKRVSAKMLAVLNLRKGSSLGREKQGHH